MPASPVRKSSTQEDNQVVVHPVPSDDTELPNRQTDNSNITVAEVHVSCRPITPEAASLKHKTAVEDWSRRALRTPSLSSSERGSDR